MCFKHPIAVEELAEIDRRKRHFLAHTTWQKPKKQPPKKERTRMSISMNTNLKPIYHH